MELKCHFYLGCCLLRRRTDRLAAVDHGAFLIGCVEPDLNVTTYLKGSLHGQRLRGHNYPNLLPRIQQLIEQLESSEMNRLLYFYRLGKLTHYLADAFTWPHNSTFPGTLKEHMAYEKKMGDSFMMSADEKIQHAMTVWDCRRLLPAISEQHSLYLNAPTGVRTDVDFITRTTAAVFAALCPKKIHRFENTPLLFSASGGTAGK